MAELRKDQANFTKGQLDGRLYARSDYDGYNQGLKVAQNCIIIPQGGIRARWGQTYVDQIMSVQGDSMSQYFEMNDFQLDDGSVYLMLWENQSIKIYLENILIAQIATNYLREDIQNLRFTQSDNALIIANENFPQAILRRSASANNAITGIDNINNYINVANPLVVGTVYPILFNTGGALPVTFPQIFPGRPYFAVPVTATSLRIYSDSQDAAAGLNYYTIIAAGVGNVQPQNTWTLGQIIFRNMPTYDFNDNYSAITFTPSATTGNVTITLSAPLATLNASFVGGAFFSDFGGILRITAVPDNQHIVGRTLEDFPNITPIPGINALLEEVIWSPTRGYARNCAFHQNRLGFFGTPSIQMAINLSVINDYFDFNDTGALSDDAISYYPQSGKGNKITAATSTRSLIVHTQQGNYSTPLTFDLPLTPATFTLALQNKDGCSPIQPVDLDNQLIFVDKSGMNVINMIWDISQSSYIRNNISVASSDLVNAPIDMTSFVDPGNVDGSFTLFVNSDGSLAVFQTLYEQGIAAWTPSSTSGNLYGNNPLPGYYRKVTSAQNRCWFGIERSVPVANAPVAIVGFNNVNSTLDAPGHGLIGGTPNLVTLTAVVPTTVPAINTNTYYWAVPTDANNFKLYANQNDATLGQNAFQILNAGVASTLIYWPIQQRYYIEEINFNVYTDSTKTQIVGGTVVNGLAHLNGEIVQVVADGYVVLNLTVVNGQITLPNAANEVTVGRAFQSTVTFLPINVLLGDGNTLYKPKHSRAFYVNYYNSFGFQIQGRDIPMFEWNNFPINEPPTPQSGVYNYTLMEGWDPRVPISITQNLPLPMTILGISYTLED